MSLSRKRLYLEKKEFMEDLQPKYIMPWLFEHKVVSDEEKKDILSFASSREQVQKLFDILFSKGQKEFESFVNILSMEDAYGVNYPWLGEMLAETNFTLESEKRRDLKDKVHQLLTDGGVPFQTNCLLPRKNRINDIRSKIIEATKTSYRSTPWVVLHGMSGTGKSVLAAEAVRDNELIEKYFPDGVFWEKLGSDIDSNGLEIRMQQLYRRILESLRIPASESKSYLALQNLDELNQNFRKLVVNRKILVVLDDLWESNNFNIVKAFDIGCTVLVTTKFPGAFDTYSQHCFKIPCRNDMEIKESKELLALYVKCDKGELPPEVDNIARKCKGSPFTISHIGRWMEPFGNDISRWKDLMNLLEKGLASAMRQRHSSEDQLREIKEIISLTLQPIEKYGDLFFDFVIFPEDVWVRTEVFTVLWNRDMFEVQNTLYDCLVSNSLVQYEKDPISGYSYGIHDLYLEILKEICRDTKERHLRLVNNYLKLCKKEDGSYDFSLLPDDDYIHYYIGHHLNNVDENDIIDGIIIDDIYFDLSFIEKKLRKDPKDLLWDYHRYKDLFKKI